MPSSVNKLLCGDRLYEISEAYRAGARACRGGTPHHANPHRDGSQRCDDWSYGHDNEAAGLHASDGVDVIEAPAAGVEYTAPEDCAPKH